MAPRIITGESTRRLRWIVTLQGGLEALFRTRRDVLIAGGVPWYTTPTATTFATPDVFVAYGVARVPLSPAPLTSRSSRSSRFRIAPTEGGSARNMSRIAR